VAASRPKALAMVLRAGKTAIAKLRLTLPPKGRTTLRSVWLKSPAKAAEETMAAAVTAQQKDAALVRRVREPGISLTVRQGLGTIREIRKVAQ
jgi:hypothetical protein